jgi:hypothetical protein
MQFFRCTIDFQHLQPASVVNEYKPIWYVLLILDPNKSGHTNVVPSTAPQQYLKDYHSSEVVSATPKELLDSFSEDVSSIEPHLPSDVGNMASKYAQLGWKLAVLVEIGESFQETENFIQLISSNPRGKQVRGIYSRATLADLVASLFRKKLWIELGLLFDLPSDSPELATLRQLRYALTI